MHTSSHTSPNAAFIHIKCIKLFIKQQFVYTVGRQGCPGSWYLRISQRTQKPLIHQSAVSDWQHAGLRTGVLRQSSDRHNWLIRQLTIRGVAATATANQKLPTETRWIRNGTALAVHNPRRSAQSWLITTSCRWHGVVYGTLACTSWFQLLVSSSTGNSKWFRTGIAAGSHVSEWRT